MGERLARLFGADPSQYNDVRIVMHAPWGRLALVLGLAAAAAALVLARPRRESMGRAGRARVAERFDRAHMVARIALLYREAANRGV